MFYNLGGVMCVLRLRAGLSVSDVSEITGISIRSIYRYERGENIPSLEYVVFLSKLCSVSIDEILRMAQFETKSN